MRDITRIIADAVQDLGLDELEVVNATAGFGYDRKGVLTTDPLGTPRPSADWRPSWREPDPIIIDLRIQVENWHPEYEKFIAIHDDLIIEANAEKIKDLLEKRATLAEQLDSIDLELTDLGG